MVQISLLLILLVTLVAIFAEQIAPYSPSQQMLADRLKGPSAKYLLGTDSLGRDIFSRVVFGARISLLVGVVSCVVGTLAGAFFGTIAGYFGGWIDNLFNRVADIFLAFPGLLTALVLVAALGASLANVIIAITLSIVPRIAKLIRASVLSIRERDYVQAAKSLGASHARIILRHVIPNSIAPVLVFATLQVPTAIIAEASLSFLGAGVPPPTPTWGGMVSEGKSMLIRAPWIALGPGGAIALTVLAFNMLGDTVRDMLDARLRKAGGASK